MLLVRSLRRSSFPIPILWRCDRYYFTSDDDDGGQMGVPRSGVDDSDDSDDDDKAGATINEQLSFFEGGTGYRGLPSRRGRRRPKDPLNVEGAEVPWVDDWYRTRQGFERVNLLAQKTDLSVDQVQQRISKLLSVAPGLQKFMPLLHPNLFSAVVRNLSHSFEIMTMMKSELPVIDVGTVVSGFPRVLTWEKQLLYDCMCFLVVHYKGRKGAAEALNAFPMRLKFLRQLIPVLFADPFEDGGDGDSSPIVGRLYQFNKHHKKSDMARNKLVFFEKGPRLRE